MKEKLTGTVINPDVVRGKSAYEIAVMNGFDGTEEEWVESLRGGIKEITLESSDAYQSWYRIHFMDGSTYDFAVKNGEKGDKGDKGDKGNKGDTGKTAFEYAVEGGFKGTEEEFEKMIADPVLDGSLTENKFTDELKKTTKNAYVTPEMFGAVGDGTADDTEAVRAALNSGNEVLLCGTYLIKGNITSNTQRVKGNGAKFVINGNCIDGIRFNNIKELEGITIDGSGYSVKYAVVVRPVDGDGVVVKNIEVCNIFSEDVYGKGEPYFANGISFSGENCIVECENIYVHDIKCVANGEVADTSGAAQGIYAGNFAKLTAKNLKFEEIHCVDKNGDIIFEDAAGIFVRSENPQASAYMTDVQGVNFGKRLIKAQCANMIVDGVVSFNEYTDNLTVVGILDGYLPFPIKAVISNCIFTDTADVRVAGEYEQLSRAITCIGDVVVSNCQFNIANNYCISNDNDGVVIVRDCIFNGNAIAHNYGDMKVSGCTFNSNTFIKNYYSDTREREGDLTIENCTLNYNGGEKNNIPIMVYRGSVHLNDCVINTASPFTINTLKINTDIVGHLEARHITVNLTDTLPDGAKLGNVFYINENTFMNLTDIVINVPVNVTTEMSTVITNKGTLYLSGMRLNTPNKYNYSLYNTANATAYIKDAMFEYINSKQGNLIQLDVPYVSALPNVALIPENAYCISLINGKMYKVVDGAWKSLDDTTNEASSV